MKSELDVTANRRHVDAAVREVTPRDGPPPATTAAAWVDDLEARLDEALQETFPASDPIAVAIQR